MEENRNYVNEKYKENERKEGKTEWSENVLRQHVERKMKLERFTCLLFIKKHTLLSEGSSSRIAE